MKYLNLVSKYGHILIFYDKLFYSRQKDRLSIYRDNQLITIIKDFKEWRNEDEETKDYDL